MTSFRKHNVKFELLGGLGNQLFQWAAACHYQEKNNIPVKIDLTFCGKRYSKHNSSITDLVLENAPKVEILAPRDSFATFLVERICSHSKLLNYLRNRAERRCIFRSNGYVENLLDSKALIIRGYFQSFLYLSSITEEPLRVSLHEPNKALESKPESTAIAIHLRRGDYLNLVDSFGVLSDVYYLNALEQISEKINPTRIDIFSNDLIAAEDLARKIGPLARVQNPIENETDAAILIRISEYKFLITANSSFSWWAGNLNEKKTVVYPKPWFRTLSTPDDLHPPDWIPCQAVWLEV